MTEAILAGLAASFLLPVPSMAQSAFDGTWKGDLASVKFSQKPDVYVLTTKVYKCVSCVPPISVKADGAPHKVPGHPYYDAVAMKIVDANSAHETDYKAGKIVAETTSTVSDDGKTLNDEFTDSSNRLTPVAAVQRKASGLLPTACSPPMTEPSNETAPAPK